MDDQILLKIKAKVNASDVFIRDGHYFLNKYAIQQILHLVSFNYATLYGFHPEKYSYTKGLIPWSRKQLKYSTIGLKFRRLSKNFQQIMNNHIRTENTSARSSE